MFFLLKSTIHKVFLALGAFTTVLLLSMGGFIAWFFLSLPDPQKLKSCFKTEMNKVYLCEKDPSFVQTDQVSPFALNAIIVSEDASFFGHDGIDVEEIKESFIKNLNEGRFARGGSTITQQLAKNVFLSPDKSLIRKAQEVYLAFQIEELFTKKRILTYYINVVEFGPDIFGIKKASEYYFKKHPSQLTPEEGAFLAFLLPNPKKYHQSFKQKKLTDFANKTIKTILHKMYRAHKLTESEYVLAKSKSSHLFGQKAEGLNIDNLSESALDKLIEQEDLEGHNENTEGANNSLQNFKVEPVQEEYKAPPPTLQPESVVEPSTTEI